MLLKRVFDLPLGVHELVIDFLPAPRIWKLCIHRLKRRVTLAPQAATLDISIMLDEMITDMCLFRPPRQRGHLIALSRNESVAVYLREQWHMPTNLISELVQWSDVQSLIARSADCDVSFKANLARKFLHLAASMYRYLSSFSNPRILFAVSNLKSASIASRRGLCWASSAPLSISSSSDSNDSQKKSGADDMKDSVNERDNHCNDLMDIDFLVDIDDDDMDDDNDNDLSRQGGGGGKSSSSVPLSGVHLTPLHQLEHQHQHHQHQPFQEEYENEEYNMISDDDDDI